MDTHQGNITIRFGGVSVSIHYPIELNSLIQSLCGKHAITCGQNASDEITISAESTSAYLITSSQRDLEVRTTEEEVASTLLDMITSEITYSADAQCIFHSAAVGKNGKSIVIAAPLHQTRNRLAAHLIACGWSFFTSEITSVESEGVTSSYFGSPLRIEHSDDPGSSPETVREEVARSSHYRFISVPDNGDEPPATWPIGLFVFARFIPGSPASMSCLSTAQTALKLTESLANGPALGAASLPRVAAMARRVPSLELLYGSDEQVAELSESVLSFLLTRSFNPSELHKFIAPFSHGRQNSLATAPPSAALPRVERKAPDATPKGKKKRLTIGMATYDDFDGVFFTAVSLRFYHPEITDISEIVVIDNNPTGPCAASLKKLDKTLAGYRYIPFNEYNSTAVRDLIFREAQGDYVVVLDCHVLLAPGSLARLVDYMDTMDNPKDLLQGPLLGINMVDMSSHFEPRWRKGMYGTWKKDARLENEDEQPFEIPMQGLGMFACRKDAWPGLNPRFRGFGGEEGYIHEKIRQNGGRTLCLPFLQWIHRFERPLGPPYQIKWEDRVFNYLLGHRELGLNEDPIREHFIEHLGEDPAKMVFAWVEEEMSSPFMYFDTVYCITPYSESLPSKCNQDLSSVPGLAGRVRFVEKIELQADPVLASALTLRAIISSAKYQGLETILVVEGESASFTQNIAVYKKEMQDLASRKEWRIFRLHGESPPPPSNDDHDTEPDSPPRHKAVAYRHSVYETILDDIPEPTQDAGDWLKRYGSLENYLNSIG